MSHFKLMKLLNLSDWEAMERYGFPISGDRIVSMDQGPVLSMILNLMDGDVESLPGGWDTKAHLIAQSRRLQNKPQAPRHRWRTGISQSADGDKTALCFALRRQTCPLCFPPPPHHCAPRKKFAKCLRFAVG